MSVTSQAAVAVGGRARARAVVGEQLGVATGQLGAGIGNLAFSLAAARLLAPRAFAELASFLALYLLIHMPLASLSAGSAIAPERVAAVRLRLWRIGLAAGAGLAIAAVPLSALLRLPLPMILALAAAAPTAGPIALERGRLYGLRAGRRVVASLLAEPAVRLSLGVALAGAVGATGAAAAVVLAGWAGLAVAGARGGGPVAASAGPRAWPAVVAFLLLAAVQSQDVLLAHVLLPGDEAGRFAVLSTVGGAAAFATTTVPLMLLPRVAAGDRRALPVAVVIAALLGGGVVLAAAAAPGPLLRAGFGARYGDVAPLVVPYVGAMALLGVARVLAADAVARGGARLVLALLGGAALLHAALIVTTGHDAGSVARATVVTAGALTAGVAGTSVARLPAVRVRSRRAGEALVRPVTLTVIAATAVGIVLRLLATRGIWLDEATSIHQARMSYGAMLDNLRTTDVHPPLHHTILWVTVRLIGDGERAVRVPSLIAGAAMVPMLYVAGRDLWDRRAGVAAAVLGVVAPFAVWYSDEARMYALFMLFALIAVWAQARILRAAGRPRKRDWAIYALATVALLYDQYFSSLVVVVQQAAFVAAIVARRRDPAAWRPLLAGWLATGAVIVLAILPLAGFAHAQFAANESAGRGFDGPAQVGSGVANGGAKTPSVYGAITNLVWAVWGYHSDATMAALSALWPAALLLALLLLGRGRNPITLLVVAVALLPAAVLFVVGEAKPSLFEVRYFIAAVPMLLLLSARALTSWARSAAAATALTAVFAASLAGGLLDQQVNGANPRLYDFRGALHDVERHFGPHDVLVYTPSYLTDVIGYYAPRLRAQPLGQPLPRHPRGRVFVLASFLDKPQYAAQTGGIIAQLRGHRPLLRTTTKSQVRVWEFGR